MRRYDIIIVRTEMEEYDCLFMVLTKSSAWLRVLYNAFIWHDSWRRHSSSAEAAIEF
jgi:hypothetical protein